MEDKAFRRLYRNIAGLACDMRERGKNGTQGNNIGRNDSSF